MLLSDVKLRQTCSQLCMELHKLVRVKLVYIGLETIKWTFFRDYFCSCDITNSRTPMW